MTSGPRLRPGSDWVASTEGYRSHRPVATDSYNWEMPAVGKKLHHKVARFYLKAWDERGRDTDDAQVFCLQGGEVRRANVRNVAAENHFYRLRELSEADVQLIRKVAVDDSPAILKPYHERLIRWFSLPHRMRKSLETSGRATPELLGRVDRAIHEMSEDLHTSIEDQLKPYLESMRRGDLSFYSDPKKAGLFFIGIAAQYLRTDLVKKGKIIWTTQEFRIFERIANVLVHIYAVNLGRSLYVDGERYQIVLLENRTDVPFVTGDQPVINIAARPIETKPPTKFELYYPVSPTRAMLLVEPSSDHFPKDSFVSAMAVHIYNSHVAAHSYQQVFGNTANVLEALKADFSAIRSCL